MRFGDEAAAIAADIGHRPWNPPRVPWVMYQSWRDLLFMHWPVPKTTLRARVPAELEIDEFDGSAWLGLTPFEVRDLHLRGVPPLPGLSHFPEMNLRTYVTHRGRPGIYFFTLDTTSRLAVLAARALYRLPYRRAEMRILHFADRTRYVARRDGSEFDAVYRPEGAEFAARPDSLEYFLVERYALYSTLPGGRLLRGEIQHRPWRLRSALADVEHDTVARAHGIVVPPVPPLLHHAARQDTLIWPPVVSSRPKARLVPTYG